MIGPLLRGFVKSRPAAQRPAARHGPTAQRPSGPRPTARHGPAIRRPSDPVLIFHNFFLVQRYIPSACTDLHQVSASKMDDAEFEFVYQLIIWILGSVFFFAKNDDVFHLATSSERKDRKGLKWLSKWHWTELTSPSSILHAQAETPCRSVHALGFTTAQKTLWKIRSGPPGSRAAGPWWAMGLRAAGPWRAAGPSGLRAAGLWRAVGRGPAFSKILYDMTMIW